MHAAKRLAIRSCRHNAAADLPATAASTAAAQQQADFDLQLERSKVRLRERFEALAAGDRLFSSLFSLRRQQQLLGVGSFGMVLQAEAVANITGQQLLLAQATKCDAERAVTSAGAGCTPELPRRRSLERHPAAVVLRQGDMVAVKFEYNIDQQRSKFQLVKEHNLLVELFNCYDSKLEGFPQPYLFGCLGSSTFADSSDASSAATTAATAAYHCYHFFVMELLGENLRPLFDNLPAKQPGRTAFPVEFAFDVARQLLTRLMLLHSAPISVTHNDLKLDQLMMGRGDKRNIVYLVDFGLSLKYKHRVKARWGNRRYASRFRHHGINSPLTDLESAAYVVARFLHNDFPWDGLQCPEAAKKRRMASLKEQLWAFVDRARRGRCLRGDGGDAAAANVAAVDAASVHRGWGRRFFADRTDAASGGRGGPELLKYMSRLAEYSGGSSSKSRLLLPAEAIDYNYLFNCFAGVATATSEGAPPSG